MTLRSRARGDADARSDVDAIVVLRMGAANAGHHVRPIATAVGPARTLVVRPASDPGNPFEHATTVVDTSGGPAFVEVLRTFLVTLRLTLQHRPRHLFSFNALPYGLITAWVGRLTNTPTHVGFVGTDAQRISRRRWLLALYPEPDVLTVTGSAMVRLLRRSGWPEQPFEVLPHGVDEHRFQPPPTEQRDVDVLFVGGLHSHKRVHHILAAAAHARASVADLQVVIVGDGPERAALEQLALELGIQRSIQFVGHDDAPERWFARTRLLCMASAWEGLPFVVVEAMRCGAVPVVTDVGSIRDLVVDGSNGRLLPADVSEEAMGRAISDVLGDQHRYRSLQQAALESVRELTYADVAQWWTAILRRTRPGASDAA